MEREETIIVTDVTKHFKIYPDKGNTFKEKVIFRKRNRYELREVLKGISFSVHKGEAIGLIGHNGCGKSTTLKLLTKIMYPDSGSIQMKGRVSSLIELGAGFHGDMSGRENIYINASIFGLTKKEIDSRVDDIIAFSELGAYIDNPVRTYSSGMYMRLAFAVAINVDADILLIDEILAVGDQSFQNKCFEKLKEIKANGTTIVIVSHALGQIEEICERSIWIHEGLIKEEGDPKRVHPHYLQYMDDERKRLDEEEAERKKALGEGDTDAEDSAPDAEDEVIHRWGNGDVRITGIHFNSADGEERYVYSDTEKVVITVEYKVNKPVKEAIVGFGIYRADGVLCYGTNNLMDENPIDLTEDGKLTIDIDHLNLVPAEYLIDLTISDKDNNPVDFWTDACRFNMVSRLNDMGIVHIKHTWKMD